MTYIIAYFLIGFVVAAIRPKSWDAYTAFPATVLFWLPAGLVIMAAYMTLFLFKEGRK